MFSARVIEDSISSEGVRLTTIEATYPLIVHAEMLTHRAFSRNTASNRAIPFHISKRAVQVDPFVPTWWGEKSKGMQASKDVSDDVRHKAAEIWKEALADAVKHAERLEALGMHKERPNRLLGPFQWTTCLITATDWENFFYLRTDSTAQVDMQTIAKMIQDVYQSSSPVPRMNGEWHLPLISEYERDIYAMRDLLRISAGRCARVSYLTHEGIRDPLADINLYDSLVDNWHMSPLEHQARATNSRAYSGNFHGWIQHRQVVEEAIRA